MPSEKIKFENADGIELSGRLDTPKDRDVEAYALFAHCFTCSKNLNAVGHITRSLNAGGYGVLRFDFTGLGESEGDFADTNFSSNVDDLVVAANFLAEKYKAPSLLIGHSLGGAAVLSAAGAIDSARAVVTIGAPADPQHVKHLFGPHHETIVEDGKAEVVLAGRKFHIKRQFLEDLEEHRLEHQIADLKRALLVCHAPFDDTVGIDNASKIFGAAKHPKSFLSLDGADHLLTRQADSRYVGHVIAAWAERYVDTES